MVTSSRVDHSGILVQSHHLENASARPSVGTTLFALTFTEGVTPNLVSKEDIGRGRRDYLLLEGTVMKMGRHPFTHVTGPDLIYQTQAD